MYDIFQELLLLAMIAAAYVIVVFLITRLVAFIGHKLPMEAAAPVLTAGLLSLSVLFIASYAQWQMERLPEFTFVNGLAIVVITLLFLLGHALGFAKYVPRRFLAVALVAYPLGVAFWIFLVPTQ